MNHSNQNFANPLQLSKMSMKQSRNAFKMSYHENFSSPVGQIIPCHVQDICPGDYVKLNLKSFSRTVPCNTAAFARMSEHVDFYFVPYHMLWRPFKQLVNPVPDVNSALSTAAEKANKVTGVPYFTARQVVDMFSGNDVVGYFMDLPRRPFAARLLDMLSYYSDPTHAYLNNGTNVVNGQDNTWITNFTSAYGDDWKFNPFRILAFNRILSDFYRVTDYTQSNPRRFNIDDLESGTQIPDERLRSFFHVMKSGDDDASPENSYSCFPFAKWHLDRLISVKPSQLYGSFTNPDPSIVNSSYQNIFSFNTNYGSVDSSAPSTANRDYISDTQSLRIAQSLEKIGRLAMSAPKTFRAQQAALFGESSPSCDNCSPRYLGSYDSSLDISEVTASTAYDGGSPETSNYLGEVGGKGTSTNQKNGVIKFKAEDFGVIIGVHYIVPDAEYQMNRYNRHCCKLSRSDFFNPAFDRLGLQPLYRGEVILDNAEGNQTVVGMQARYIEYKTRENEVHGNFQRGRNLQSWSIPRNIDYSATDGISRFYVSPDVVDSLFKASYDGTEVTDQFYCHYFFDQTIVQNKSAVGLPIL